MTGKTRGFAIVTALGLGSLLSGGRATALGATSEAQLAGAWQSARTCTRPLPGQDFFLDVEFRKDGTFEGVYATYDWLPHDALGPSVVPATSRGSRSKKTEWAFGRLDLATMRGEITLGRVGRSTFVASLAQNGELTIELPKEWHGEPAILFRSVISRSR
jgi:hypothetical protein